MPLKMKGKVVRDNMAKLSKAWITALWTEQFPRSVFVYTTKWKIRSNKTKIMSKTKIPLWKNTHAHPRTHIRIHTFTWARLERDPKRFPAENNRVTVSKFFHNSNAVATPATTKSTKVIAEKLFLFCDACSEANKHFYIFYSISEPEAIFRQNNKTPSQRFNNGTIDPDSVVIRFNPQCLGS